MLKEKYNPKDFEDRIYEIKYQKLKKKNYIKDGKKRDILSQVWTKQKKIIAL